MDRPESATRRCLGPLDLLVAKEREQERSRRVALSGRSIYCTRCQLLVGVVALEDMKKGNGAVSCPQCSALYCSECGTEEHGKAPCPAPKDMEKWLGKNAKNTKRCPNCGVAVSKNGGCNHMTCAASAGVASTSAAASYAAAASVCLASAVSAEPSLRCALR